MSRFKELNYYELLEIPMNASAFEIRQAYKEAFSTYNGDSLVTYSLFRNDERGKILANIEKAFQTLIDEDSRAEYDGMLVNTGQVDSSVLAKKDGAKIIPLFHANAPSKEDVFSERIRKKIEASNVKEISREIVSKESVSGKDLRELRESLGVSLEEIFEITRIGVFILKSIEENDLASLPSPIYLKSFVATYAEILQLDSKKFVAGYIKNIALAKDKA
ncbi:MAG: helix-turn-helix domain-containing protein [Desulfobacteraceae bacterium]|nr:helix-turn-helix domain-containing protein [Desulfobacteraceae bacterium]